MPDCVFVSYVGWLFFVGFASGVRGIDVFGDGARFFWLRRLDWGRGLFTKRSDRRSTVGEKRTNALAALDGVVPALELRANLIADAKEFEAQLTGMTRHSRRQRKQSTTNAPQAHPATSLHANAHGSAIAFVSQMFATAGLISAPADQFHRHAKGVRQRCQRVEAGVADVFAARRMVQPEVAQQLFVTEFHAALRVVEAPDFARELFAGFRANVLAAKVRQDAVEHREEFAFDPDATADEQTLLGPSFALNPACANGRFAPAASLVHAEFMPLALGAFLEHTVRFLQSAGSDDVVKFLLFNNI